MRLRARHARQREKSLLLPLILVQGLAKGSGRAFVEADAHDSESTRSFPMSCDSVCVSEGEWCRDLIRLQPVNLLFVAVMQMEHNFKLSHTH